MPSFEKMSQSHQDTPHKNPGIRLRGNPGPGRCSCVPPACVASFLPRPWARLAGPSTMPALRAGHWRSGASVNSLQHHPRHVPGLSKVFCPKAVFTATPCRFRTLLLPRHHPSSRIYVSWLVALCLQHNHFPLHCFVPHKGGKLSEHLIFYNYNSPNPYNSRL